LIPYIGGGPSLNVIKISGTGESGHFVDPVCGDACVSNAGNIHDTSVNIGANFKIGAEYKIDKAWGLGAEYHYNWVPIDISHFRSANNLNADLEMQSVNLVLTRHF
jgi:opacity protein-like surface antigen